RLFKRFNQVADGATQVIHRAFKVLDHVGHIGPQGFDDGAGDVAHVLGDSASQGSDRPQQIRDLWCRIGDMPNTVADPLEEIHQALLELGPLERFEELLERVTDHVADYRLELLEHVGAVPDEVTDSPQGTLEPVRKTGSTLEQVFQNLLALSRLERFVQTLHTGRPLTETREPSTLSS